VLAGFLALMWLSVFGRYSSPNVVAHMAEGGRTIVLSVAWFEFMVSQLLAILLMSRSISDEINKRTLGVLMSTPVKSIQIVAGKLLGGLAQLLMLLCIALPLLAMLRMLGGIDWATVIGSFCLTVTTSLFLGSVSLFFSIFNRQSFVVMLMTMMAAALLYLGLPMLVGYAMYKFSLLQSGFEIAIAYVHPYVAMGMLSVRGMGLMGVLGSHGPWIVCSGVSLLATAAMVAISTGLVRKAALRQAAGDFQPKRRKASPPPPRLPPAAPTPTSMAVPPPLPPAASSPDPFGRIRNVWDNSILWRELHTPLLPRKVLSIVMLILALLALAVAYIINVSEGDLFSHHAIFCVPLFLFGAVATVLTSATSITAEKEARTWPLLLLTDRSNGAIIRAKALGIMRRCLLPFSLLIGHQIIFCFINLPPITLAFTLAIVLGFVTFMTGSGLYFSARMKSSTAAAVANLALALAIWLVLPICWAIAERYPMSFSEVLLNSNPVVQIAVVAEAEVRKSEPNGPFTTTDGRRYDLFGLEYDWPMGHNGVIETGAIVGGCAVGYGLLGLLLAGLATRRLRKNAVT
jgi:ABC-type transport system involved in multi-copper enzyme maturation permease subunit